MLGWIWIGWSGVDWIGLMTRRAVVWFGFFFLQASRQEWCCDDD